jgi:hypothetical protein
LVVGLPSETAGPELDMLPPYFEAQKGKQNVRDTGLAGLSDDEVSRRARDRSLPPEDRRRYQKEEKARKQRNKQKRCP